MKQEHDNDSELLERHFAPRRREPPLLATRDVRGLLQRADMLPETGSRFRSKFLMTLSGIAALGAALTVAYFTHVPTSQSPELGHVDSFSSAAAPQNTSSQVSAEHAAADTTRRLRTLHERISVNPAAAPAPPLHNVSSNAQGSMSEQGAMVYAELSQAELAQIGVRVSNDTVYSYKTNEEGKIELSWQTDRMIGGGEVIGRAPVGVAPHTFYPTLITTTSGHGAGYRVETAGTREWVELDDADKTREKKVREWLKGPGNPGLYALGFSVSQKHLSIAPGKVLIHDTVRIRIAKNFPSPIEALPATAISSYGPQVNEAIEQAAKYYDGTSAQAPSSAWPSTLTVLADTITPQDYLAELDRAASDEALQKMNRVLGRIDELIPILVHSTAGVEHDLILWYEPTDELLRALPQYAKEAFRNRTAPQCLNLPKASAPTFDVHFCLEQDGLVDVTVRDLTGRVRLLTAGEHGRKGDNIVKIDGEYLTSGMYIVTLRDANGSEQSRRIWIENPDPKQFRGFVPKSSSEGRSITVVNSMLDTTYAARVGMPAVPMLDLSAADLRKIGVTYTNLAGRFFVRSKHDTSQVMLFSIARKWGAQIRKAEPDEIPDHLFGQIPSVVTDGFGRKRAWVSESLSQSERVRGSERVDSLVPVLLRADATHDLIGAMDLIFWYKATPEFLAALPNDSIRDVARQAAEIAPAHRTVLNISTALTSVQVYPNPSAGRVTLSIALKEDRHLTVTVRDLLGRALTTSELDARTNTVEEPLDLSTLEEGVYLLDVKTDAGEETLQRIVIAR